MVGDVPLGIPFDADVNIYQVLSVTLRSPANCSAPCVDELGQILGGSGHAVLLDWSLLSRAVSGRSKPSRGYIFTGGYMPDVGIVAGAMMPTSGM